MKPSLTAARLAADGGVASGAGALTGSKARWLPGSLAPSSRLVSRADPRF